MISSFCYVQSEHYSNLNNIALYKFSYINFDDPRLSIEAEDLNDVIEAFYSLNKNTENIIFDEIQNIEGWERFVNSISTSKKIIITGSNARLMSKELATYLVGRHIDFTLFPFSFREFLDYKSFKINENKYTSKWHSRIIDNLGEYMQTGGIPLAMLEGSNYLLQLYSDILERDILQRYKVNYPNQFKSLSDYLLSDFSNEITYNKLKNIVSIKTSNTISKWIMYLSNSYLIFTIERFSSKIKESIKAPKKLYAIDTGIACAVNSNSKNDKGRLMENLVAIELMRRIKYWNNSYSIYYWKNVSNWEVDFLLRKEGKTDSLIQVTYASSISEIKEREINSLIKASTEQNCEKLVIITWDIEDTMTIKGKMVKLIPIWKWLTEDYKSLDFSV